MKIDFIKNKSFIVSFLLFLFLSIIAVINLTWSWKAKCASILLLMVLWVINEYLRQNECDENTRKKIITGIFSSINVFKKFNNDQNLRANIFLENKKTKKYYLKYSYNMESSDDKNFEIPLNMGCTGETWRAGMQVWGDKKRIFGGGEYRIPDDELKKVPKDLEWICSTPIKINNVVIAVLNFDGNKKMDKVQENNIKAHCQKNADELKDVLK